MIVLHAVWSADGGLGVWGESSSPTQPSGWAPPASAREASEPRLHPFACDGRALATALAPVATPAALRASSETTLTLLLPSSDLEPEASPHLLRVLADETPPPPPTRSAAWRVDALRLSAAAAVDLLLGLPASPPLRLALGDSLRHLGEACKLALEFVARGHVRPALERRGEQWYAVWRPVVEEEADETRVRLLAATMPPLLAAEAGAGGGSARTDALVAAFLAAAVDACARELLDGRLDEAGGPHAQLDGALAAWLEALVDADPVVVGDPWEIARLAEQVEQWWATGQSYAATRMFRTCFRLVPPQLSEDAPESAAIGAIAPAQRPRLTTPAEPEPEAEVWRVEFLLQHKDDPSVLVPAEEVWAHGERLSALGRMLEHPQERLLGGLGHALRLWPELAPALEQAAPTAIELSAEQAYRFLHEAVPRLETAGFAVLTPPWWRQRLRLTLSASPVHDWEEGTGLFGVDGLCAYEWRVALGDDRLTLEELEALAELKLPLVKARGRWIALRSEDVEMALRFFRNRQASGQASAAELIREAVVGSGRGREEQPEVEIEAGGWLGELLGNAGERRLRDVPTPRSFEGELRSYQRRGLAWLSFMSSIGLGACLADDMGLGKTIQMLALLLAEREADQEPGARGRRRRPTLLVCPVSLAGNWQREAERFAPTLSVHVHYGRERLKGRAFARAAERADLVITTYGLAVRDRDTLAGFDWDRVVLDEAQNVKTREAKQTRAVRALRSRHRVALTGTPVENRLAELHSIMDFLNPGMLGSEASFREQFATPIERWRDGSAAAKLRRLTAPFVLRRLKTDPEIAGELPDKIELRVDCHLTSEQATLYEAVVREMLERVEQEEGIARAGIVLQTLVKLKQVCNHPAHLLRDRSRLAGRSDKLARLEEILEEAVSVGDKALCFTQFAEFGHQLRSHLQERLGREVLFLHGGTPKVARDQMVERFQSPDGPSVFVLSLRAGGTGLNLTAANHVIHFDRWWNPAVENQATDRAFRIGQRKNVQVRKLTCVGTLEERIDQLIEEKKELADQIVGSGEAWLSELDPAQLRELVALGEGAVAA